MDSKMLLIVVLALFASCTKPELAPDSPFVGEWYLHRIIYSGFPQPLQAYNRTDSNATRIGTEIFHLLPDSSFIHEYSLNRYARLDTMVLARGTLKGRWTFNSDKPQLIECIPDGPSFLGVGTHPLTLKGDELSLFFTDGFGQLHNYLSSTYPIAVYHETHLYRRKR